MKFVVFRTSGKRLNIDQPKPATQYDAERPDWPKTWEIELETMQELIDFVNRFNGLSVIISPPFEIKDWTWKSTITIENKKRVGIMAGGTKCYEVKRDALGKLWWTVVEHSPKFADSPKAAVEKLRAGESAHVRFHEVNKVEQEFEHSRREA